MTKGRCAGVAGTAAAALSRTAAGLGPRPQLAEDCLAAAAEKTAPQRPVARARPAACTSAAPAGPAEAGGPRPGCLRWWGSC